MNGNNVPILLVIIFLSGCSMMEEAQNDWQEMNLKGNVKSIHQINYEAEYIFGELQRGELINSNYRLFNEDGNLVKSKWFDEDSIMTSKEIYIYDYDEKLIERNGYRANGDLSSNKKYNDSRNEVKFTSYDEDGLVSMKTIERYDDKGNKIMKEQYGQDGKLMFGYFYKYERRTKTRYTYSQDVDPYRSQVDQYDRKGRVIARYLGNWEHLYEYDNNGNRISMIANNRRDDAMSYRMMWSYKYDNYDNWITQVKYRDFQPRKIRLRYIKYYD